MHEAKQPIQRLYTERLQLTGPVHGMSWDIDSIIFFLIYTTQSFELFRSLSHSQFRCNHN